MCAIGTYKGQFKKKATGETGIGVMPISCGKWVCEECRPVKARALMARAMKGLIAQSARHAESDEQYNFKTLTLTYGGREIRAKYSREEAAIQMRDALRKLIVFLRKQLGWFNYIRVTEDQKDGYPHYHILLSGRNVAPKWVLRMIEDAWRGEYGMGFVKLHKIHTVDKAIKYVLKYLFKNPSVYEGLRLFSSSKEAILKKNPSAYEWTHGRFEAGHFKGCVFAGACFQGAFLRSTDGRKVLIHGKCSRHDLYQLEACFDSTGERGMLWIEAPEGESQYGFYYGSSDRCPF